MTDNLPTRFEDLNVEELRRSAEDDFAVVIGAKDNPKKVIAALTESGVGWSDYVKMHPEVLPVVEEVVVDKEKNPVNVITNPNATDPTTLSVETEVVETKTIRTAEPLVNVADPQDYLLKMERENPLYETRGYRFTKTHPFQVVSAKDAQWILSNEQGFRMAWPNELQEYYS